MEKVKVYDLITKKVIEIPIVELAPGMARVEVEGKDGEYWIDMMHLKRSHTFKNPCFEGNTKRKIEEISFYLHEVYPKTYKQWEDGFRADAHPQKEIDLWLNLAKKFQRITEEKNYMLSQKKDIFKILISVLLGGKSAKVVCHELINLDKNEANKIIDKFLALEGTV